MKVSEKLVRLAPKGSIDIFMSNNRCYLMDKGTESTFGYEPTQKLVA